MHKGLTKNIESIFEKVAQLECIEPYVLCGGTALALQIDHRKSEDLDFMQWRQSSNKKPEINWPIIEKELIEKIGPIENFNMLGFDQVEFRVSGVKLSFYVSDNYSPVTSTIQYLGNMRIADIESIMAMKLEVMLRRMKYRDLYDLYSILKEGYSIAIGIEGALKYSKHKLNTRNIISMLIGGRYIEDENFNHLEPKYKVDVDKIREFIQYKLKQV